MVKKEKRINWTAIIVLLIVLGFISIIVFKFDNGNSNNMKTIKVSGLGEEITISDKNPTIVYISGLNAIVHFSKDSNPEEVYLSGMGSIAYLCEGIHNPYVSATGLNAKTIYGDC